MRYEVSHVTRYETTEPVSVCHNIARLRPRQTPSQMLLGYELLIDPEASIRSERIDSFGNSVTYFSASAGYSALRVEARSHVDVSPAVIEGLEQSPPWDLLAAELSQLASSVDPVDPRQYLYDSPRIYRNHEFKEYALESFQAGRPVLAALRCLTTRIHKEFRYDPTVTNVSTPIREVFAKKAGVCQDFAHLQIAMLRSIGLPTRYVSGYIRTYPAKDKEQLIGAAASHAWLSVFTGDPSVGSDGWVDTDPTNNKFLTDEYVTVAWGRDYTDVAPLKGVFVGSGQHSLHVEVEVREVATAASKADE